MLTYYKGATPLFPTTKPPLTTTNKKLSYT